MKIKKSKQNFHLKIQKTPMKMEILLLILMEKFFQIKEAFGNRELTFLPLMLGLGKV